MKKYVNYILHKRTAKILLFFSILAMFSGVSYAGTITLATISADATAAGFDRNFTIIANEFNGKTQGSATTGSTTNILADSIGELDMGDEVNPRIRDSELLGITTDSTTASNAFVDTGLTPADSANLTSDISTGTAYINGYRVNKAATSKTYTASRDTYVDLSQTGVFAYSEVAVGAAAPAVASNSARLAKVTTDGTEITAVTDLANRRIPGLIIPSHYRTGLYISRDSATTLKVFPGSVEINNSMVSKTATTTLTLTTAGDWAGGTSLQAVSTYGYVGMDTSGNLKMHTTAPSHDNYGVSTTAGKKRYATWSTVVYRILGWFYMNATGSGELNTYEVGNIKEADVSNSVQSSSTTQVSTASTTFVSDTEALINFYSSGNPITVEYDAGTDNGGGSFTYAQISVDSVGVRALERGILGNTSTTGIIPIHVNYHSYTLSQGTHAVQAKLRANSSTSYVNFRALKVREE